MSVGTSCRRLGVSSLLLAATRLPKSEIWRSGLLFMVLPPHTSAKLTGELCAGCLGCWRPHLIRSVSATQAARGPVCTHGSSSHQEISATTYATISAAIRTATGEVTIALAGWRIPEDSGVDSFREYDNEGDTQR